MRPFSEINWNLAHRQNVSFRTSPQTGVGISIEFRVTHRHPVCSFTPFPVIWLSVIEKWCFYPVDCHASDRRLLPWQSPSNSRTRNVIHRRGAHLERPAEKFLIFRFLSAKRCNLTEIFAKTHGTIPSGTQRRNDNTPGPSRLVSRHCRPRLGPGPCPAGAQDERPYEV